MHKKLASYEKYACHLEYGMIESKKKMIWVHAGIYPSSFLFHSLYLSLFETNTTFKDLSVTNDLQINISQNLKSANKLSSKST